MGKFFHKLGTFFSYHGASVHTICFNAGDYYFSAKPNSVCYKGTAGEWPGFLDAFLRNQRITKILLFGNCRFYHKVAIHLAKTQGIKVFVFEEGYIRPNYVTLEEGGVNGDSNISKTPHFYHGLREHRPTHPVPAKNRYSIMAIHAATYYLLLNIFKPLFPHYLHHRNQSLVKETFYGLRNGVRKMTYAVKERHYKQLFDTQLHKKYYFVPLQTRTDFQIKVYSRFHDIESFIYEVITSFAKYAPSDTYLVIKHHPMERGMATYDKYINNLSKELGINNRILSVHDVHLPTCLINAIGTIVINSTVGISSLFHNIPTIVLGTAIYDIAGISCHGIQLDDFWVNPQAPDRQLFSKFRNYVIENTQLNGGFYGNFPNFHI